MSLVTIPPLRMQTIGLTNTTGGNTMDAAGESSGVVGQVYLADPSGGSKTISSAGGKLWLRSGSVTFANAGTTIRAGIQDVDPANGLEDGTYDVYGELVGGGGGLAANSYNEFAMSSGTKTIAHGDLVVVVVEMMSRGGSDSVSWSTNNSNVAPHSNNAGLTGTGFPYGTVDTGTRQKSANSPAVFLVFDDGTYGWIEFQEPGPASLSASSTNINTGSNPDELAACFHLPFKCTLTGVVMGVGNVATADDFELILYSDPFGTPVAERTVTMDAMYYGTTGGNARAGGVFAPYTLLANTDYAVAVRPTTANNITVYYFTTSTGKEAIKRSTIFGESIQLGSRQNQSGAFSVSNTALWPDLVLTLSQIDDGSGGGGGNTYSRGRIVNGGL